MCGRYVFRWEAHAFEWERLENIIKEKFPDETIPEGEIFPGYTMPVFVKGKVKADVRLMQWGYEGFSKGKTIINARAESVFEKKFFYDDAMNRRCAVPANGFFEWSHDEIKTKYYFSLENINMTFMAGIYNINNRFAVLTTEANDSMIAVHSRMPVIIGKNELLQWLNDDEYAAKVLRRTGPALQKSSE